MEISLEKFSDAVEELRKKKILKGEVAKALGFNSRNKLTEILGKRQKLTMKILTKFCEIYGYDIKDFLITEKDSNRIGEKEPVYKITGEKGIIEKQFETILKGQQTLRTVLLSGLEFLDLQTENVNTLRKMYSA